MQFPDTLSATPELFVPRNRIVCRCRYLSAFSGEFCKEIGTGFMPLFGKFRNAFKNRITV
jgi:hypothetical protein